MDKSVFDKQHIHVNTEAFTQEEAFKAIAKIAYEAGFVADEKAYFEGLKDREKEATTGFQDGIAIPHSKHATCLKPGIFLVRFQHAIAWNALDGQPVHVAIALTIPQDGGDEHLRILSKIARKLMNEEFRTSIKHNDDIDTLYNVIAEIEM